MRQKRLVLLSTRGTKEGNYIDRKPHILCVKVWRYMDTNFMMGYTCCTTHRKSLRHERGFFLIIYWLSWWWKKENDPRCCLCMCLCVCACVRCVNSITSEPFWWPSTASLLAKPRVGTWVPQDDTSLGWPFSSSWYYRPKKTCALGRWWVHWNVDIARRDWSLFKWRKPAHCSHCLSTLQELRGLKFLARKNCTTIVSHLILVEGNRDLTRCSVCPYYW